MAAPSPENQEETQRRRALLQCRVLDTEPEPGFDALTRLAASLLDAPIVLLSLLDERRQWFKSVVGLDARETPREYAFCNFTVAQREVLVITDAATDPRTSENPLVTDDPGIRAYAGAPITLDGGETIGTLCAIDTVPRTFDDAQREHLTLLATQAAALFDARRRAAQAEHTARELRDILDAVPAYIYFKDADNTILNLNRAAAESLRRSVDEVTNTPTEALFPPDQAAAFLATDREILASGVPRHGIEEFHEGGDGERRRIVTDKIPLANEFGEFDRIVAIATDVTDQLRVQSQLEAKNKELERFLYTASHDLKSPLVTIHGYAGFILADLEHGQTDKITSGIERIQTAAQRMRVCIDDMLELSRVGRLPARARTLELTPVIDRILDDHRPVIEAHGVTVDVALESPTVWCDPDHLEQLLDNLISNALRYGRAEHDSRLLITAYPVGDAMIELEVRDNGPGVPFEYTETIFELFNRLSADKSSSGVGLTLVRRVAELYGGRAWVESGTSAAPTGACFHVQLPAREIALRAA